eukprot:CAMPEP_0194371688 /NCGR_PEP_ID=MMETSP0174-20130528/20110_1 /TAXON_ID=216777 /ORGANISM="Proboscia alata, Strain PI-D3" /LENGTH=886 /DNA_ID=CAMNT_0039149887 /DNA_START=70 /DNA_END=2730 /DNA_ORIENTATION=-
MTQIDDLEAQSSVPVPPVSHNVAMESAAILTAMSAEVATSKDSEKSRSTSLVAPPYLSVPVLTVVTNVDESSNDESNRSSIQQQESIQNIVVEKKSTISADEENPSGLLSLLSGSNDSDAENDDDGIDEDQQQQHLQQLLMQRKKERSNIADTTNAVVVTIKNTQKKRRSYMNAPSNKCSLDASTAKRPPYSESQIPISQVILPVVVETDNNIGDDINDNEKKNTTKQSERISLTISGDASSSSSLGFQIDSTNEKLPRKPLVLDPSSPFAQSTNDYTSCSGTTNTSSLITSTTKNSLTLLRWRHNIIMSCSLMVCIALISLGVLYLHNEILSNDEDHDMSSTDGLTSLSNSNDNMNNDSSAVLMLRMAPSHLSELCDVPSIYLNETQLFHCIAECSIAATCCNNHDSNCLRDYKDECESYAPCFNGDDMSKGNVDVATSAVLPPMPLNIHAICGVVPPSGTTDLSASSREEYLFHEVMGTDTRSNEAILAACSLACAPGLCCANEADGGCAYNGGGESSNEEVCNAYTAVDSPCTLLYSHFQQQQYIAPSSNTASKVESFLLSAPANIHDMCAPHHLHNFDSTRHNASDTSNNSWCSILCLSMEQCCTSRSSCSGFDNSDDQCSLYTQPCKFWTSQEVLLPKYIVPMKEEEKLLPPVTIVAQHTPPKAPQNLEQACNLNQMTNYQSFQECIDICTLASCCSVTETAVATVINITETSSISSCLEGNEMICEPYIKNCAILLPATPAVETSEKVMEQLLPSLPEPEVPITVLNRAPDSLRETCSRENVSDSIKGMARCYQVCSVASECCTSKQCLRSNIRNCASYLPCGNMAAFLLEEGEDPQDLSSIVESLLEFGKNDDAKDDDATSVVEESENGGFFGWNDDAS